MRLISSFILLISFATIAQVDSTASKADTSKYVSFYTPEDFELELEKKKESPKEFKKKKEKKKVFYKEKTKRGYTIKGVGKKQIVEIFYYLKKWEDPVDYVKDIYWYDIETRELKRSRRYDPKTARLLHGPYKKTIGGKVVEKGVYYKGTKHARWEKFKKPKIYKYFDTIEVEEQQLVEKQKYNRGWLKESEISYYDSEKKKLKEVLPYVNGELNGEYYYFLKNGQVKIYGKYEHDQKVGKWIEYHDNERHHYRKSIIMYPLHAFTDEEPFVLQEWDENAQETLNRTKEYQKLVKERNQKRFKK